MTALYDTLLKPFVDAWDWIKGIFVGKSPSTLGLGIVKGILSIQGMLFDALTYPFRHALAWIADKFGFAGVADKLRGGFGGLANSIEGKASAGAVPPSTISPQGTTVASTTAQQTSTASTNAQDWTSKLDRNNSLLEELVGLLKAGKIQANMYLDGQLLSATLARQTEFRRGYGVNMV